MLILKSSVGGLGRCLQGQKSGPGAVITWVLQGLCLARHVVAD
jgi:hypothetical protein